MWGLCEVAVVWPDQKTVLGVFFCHPSQKHMRKSNWESFLQEEVPSGKLTWQWKITLLKMYSLLKMGIFHCYVCLHYHLAWLLSILSRESQLLPLKTTPYQQQVIFFLKGLLTTKFPSIQPRSTPEIIHQSWVGNIIDIHLHPSTWSWHEWANDWLRIFSCRD